MASTGDRHVDSAQRSGRPFLHFGNDLLGDPRDRLLGHRRPVNLREMRRDLPGGQTFRIQRQHNLIHISESPLPFLHDLRRKRSLPVPGNINAYLPDGIRDHRLRTSTVAHIRGLTAGSGAILLMPKVLSHLLTQRRFQHILREQLQQPPWDRSAPTPATGPQPPSPPRRPAPARAAALHSCMNS
jgi:hypothetical protein